MRKQRWGSKIFAKMQITQLSTIYEIYLQSAGVCTDTRALKKWEVIFCLKGPNFDANSFAQEAIRQGAILVVSDDPSNASIKGVIIVDNALETLQQLANLHRRKLNIPVLAITGSNGKTTTKELIREVLACKYAVLATQGNLNNHIGVPLTLLRLTSETEFAVIEMGANHQGEIAQLSEIAEPNYGLITNIGKAHLEGFGGVPGIIKGKTELFRFLNQTAGTIFLNTADPVLAEMKGGYPREFTFPNDADNFNARLVEASPFVRVKIDGFDEPIDTQLIGGYNFPNIAAALAIATYFEVDMSKATKAISDYLPANNRSQLVQGKLATIILDAYNANPTSMSAALDNMDTMVGYAEKWVILGDMYELGDASEEEHTVILNRLRNSAFDKVYVCGKKFHSINLNATRIKSFENREDLENELRQQYPTGAVILIKGSRAIGLEKLLNSINYE